MKYLIVGLCVIIYIYNCLGNKIADLILNLSAILKYVSSTFKLEVTLYNTVIIKMPELFSILFTTDYSQSYSGIIDAPL